MKDTWTVDAHGYLFTPSGVKAARIDSDGIIWLWDKRERVEIPFTQSDWQWCQTQTGAVSHESTPNSV